jgi:hypothetical protein
MTRSYFVALAFIRDEGDIVPGDAVECPNAMDAALQAQVLSHGRAISALLLIAERQTMLAYLAKR